MKILDTITKKVTSTPPSVVGEIAYGALVGLGLLLVAVAGSEPKDPEVIYQTVEVPTDVDPEQIIQVKAEIIED